MSTLTIKDLSITAQLDRKEMAAVRGGTGKGMMPYWTPSLSFSQNDFSFNADQQLGQSQETVVNNGNNAAFVSGITANVKPTQTGTNTISFGR